MDVALYQINILYSLVGTISHCGATQRHVSAKYGMTRYTCLPLTSCSRKLGLLDTHPYRPRTFSQLKIQIRRWRCVVDSERVKSGVLPCLVRRLWYNFKLNEDRWSRKSRDFKMVGELGWLKMLLFYPCLRVNCYWYREVFEYAHVSLWRVCFAFFYWAVSSVKHRHEYMNIIEQSPDTTVTTVCFTEPNFSL